MDDNRVKGAARNVGGKVKEGVGRAVGDEKLKREGQADQVTGKVENAVGRQPLPVCEPAALGIAAAIDVTLPPSSSTK